MMGLRPGEIRNVLDRGFKNVLLLKEGVYVLDFRKHNIPKKSDILVKCFIKCICHRTERFPEKYGGELFCKMCPCSLIPLTKEAKSSDVTKWFRDHLKTTRCHSLRVACLMHMLKRGMHQGDAAFLLRWGSNGM